MLQPLSSTLERYASQTLPVVAAACHDCGGASRLLKVCSQDAIVDYFRCDACGNVWTCDKGRTGKVVNRRKLPAWVHSS